jgi:hypothetical protein
MSTLAVVTNRSKTSAPKREPSTDSFATKRSNTRKDKARRVVPAFYYVCALIVIYIACLVSTTLQFRVAFQSLFARPQPWENLKETPVRLSETDVSAEQGCVTTLDRSLLPLDERDFLVFTAPKPLDKAHQGLPRALKRWNRGLKGKGRLVVFCNDVTTRQICAAHNIPTVCVEHTDEGLPRLDRLFARMERAAVAHGNGSIVAFVNSDIEIHSGLDTLHRFLLQLNNHTLPIRKPVQPYAPFQETSTVTSDWFVALTRYDVNLDGTVTYHSAGGFDFWSWNIRPNGPSLLPLDVPPFRYPLAVYDNWLMDILNQAATRVVIDATNLTRIHHHEHKDKGDNWLERYKAGTTGIVLNRYLGSHRPEQQGKFGHLRHYWKFGTTVEAPYRAIPGKGQEISGVYLEKRLIWANAATDEMEAKGCLDDSSKRNECALRCKNKTSWHQSYSGVFVDVLQHPEALLEKQQHHNGRGVTSAIQRLLGWKALHSENLTFHEQLHRNLIQRWRYSLTEQLRIHANPDGYVLLTAVNYAYRDHLMNFKCNLERVGMVDHFVIGALDEEIYEWGVMEGLPIFPAAGKVASTGMNASRHTIYGSDAFNSITKLKSRLVLEVLNEGYSVVWSDVDITWFTHPFEALSPYIASSFKGIAIQSNAPFVSNISIDARPHPSVGFVKSDEPTGYRRLNSGLYVATNTAIVRTAFREIVEDALKRNTSEQPSFDRILCERSPSMRYSSSCLYRRSRLGSSVEVKALDRFRFPNGAVLVGSVNENIYDLGKKRFEKKSGSAPLHCAHNNWIKGVAEKKSRQVDRGWWFIDEATWSCKYSGDNRALKKSIVISE